MTNKNSDPRYLKRLVSTRLKRLVTLRIYGAPAWIIKTEQVNLICNNRGMKTPPFVGDKSQFAQDLYDRHVIPSMGQGAST